MLTKQNYCEMISDEARQTGQNPAHLAALVGICSSLNKDKMIEIYEVIVEFAELAQKFNQSKLGTEKYSLGKLLGKTVTRYCNLTGLYLYKPPSVRAET